MKNTKMKKSGFFNKLLPHLLAILGFMIISFAFNSPEMEGKKLYQNDIVQAKGAAQELIDFREKEGRLAHWTNSMFGGMPGIMIYTDFPTSIGTFLGRLITKILPQATNLLFLYMLGFYIMMAMLGYNIWVSVFASLAFAFSSYNVINIVAGHDSKVLALAFAPPLIGAVILAYQGKYLLGGAIAGLFTSLELYANHIQITYYIFLSLALYALFLFIRIFLDKEKRSEKLRSFAIASGVLVACGLIGLASHTARLWTVYEFSKETIRGQSELTNSTQNKESNGLDPNYAFRWSYGKAESFTFLIPNFYGGGSGAIAQLGEDAHVFDAIRNNYQPISSLGINPNAILSRVSIYWGNQPFTAGPAYFGAIVCFLFVFGLFMSKDPIKWWLLTVTVLFVMISWGKNFSSLNYFLFDYFPLFNKFRAITMILSAVQLYVVWMAALGLEALIASKLDKTKAFNSLKYSVGIVGGLVLIISVLGSSFQRFETASVEQLDANGNSFTYNKDEQFIASIAQTLEKTGQGQQIAYDIIESVQDDRAALQRADAWRSFIFIALAAVLLWLFIIDKVKISYALIGITLLSLIDLWLIDRRYLNTDSFMKKSAYNRISDQPSNADLQINASQDLHYRVLNATKDVFNDATTSYYHKSIGGYHAAKLRRYQDVIDSLLSKNNMAAYNMLNTKFIIQPGEGGAPQARVNPGAKGHAWFVPEFKIVENANAEIDSLKDFDPGQIAFIDKRFNDQVASLKISPDSQASIELTNYKPDHMTYQSKTSSPQLAVFSEIYFVLPQRMEWKAYIDGKEATHFRANYILRAMVIPEGEHTIEFKFEVPVYETGKTISLIASILLILLIGGLAFVTYKEMSSSKETA